MSVEKQRLSVFLLGVLALGASACVNPRETLTDGGRPGSDGATDHEATDAPSDSPVPTDTVDAPADTADVAPDLLLDQTPVTDAPADSTGAPDISTGTKANGTSCLAAGECKSSNCVEGLCCDAACTGRCTSCLATNTGKPAGQCAPVKAGLAHATDCAASDPTTCGLDGECDGAGACRKYQSTTVCKGESCLVGTSTYSPMSVCDGNGSCVPSPKSCGMYQCTPDGVRCRLSCTVDTDCTTAAFCQTGVCVVKLAPGALCSRAEQCSSSLCGGRCCNPGVPCKCTQPSPQNLFANAGFDKNISGWGPLDPVDYLTWSMADAENCPFSGSIKSTGNTGSPGQAISIKGSTTYNWGAKFSAYDSTGTQLVCDLYVSGVTPDDSMIVELGRNTGGIGSWQLAVGTVTTTPFADTATITCEAMGLQVDQLFFTPAPGMY